MKIWRPALSHRWPISIQGRFMSAARACLAPDLAIWQHARENGLILVTKDADFQRLSVLLGPPPKVIWVGLGNSSTSDVTRLLRVNRDDIEAFLQHEEAGFLALS
jgi:predicted nuclease of predicted toxin-antitoxin system